MAKEELDTYQWMRAQCTFEFHKAFATTFKLKFQSCEMLKA